MQIGFNCLPTLFKDGLHLRRHEANQPHAKRSKTSHLEPSEIRSSKIIINTLFQSKYLYLKGNKENNAGKNNGVPFPFFGFFLVFVDGHSNGKRKRNVKFMVLFPLSWGSTISSRSCMSPVKRKAYWYLSAKETIAFFLFLSWWPVVPSDLCLQLPPHPLQNQIDREYARDWSSRKRDWNILHVSSCDAQGSHL